jgi:hypothetical protein
MSEKVKLVYILGEGRSGTTLLDLLLGQIDGFHSTGEVRLLWKRGLRENFLCGCGEPFRECPFWSRVVQHAFGSPEQIDVQRMLALDSSLLRTRHIPRLVLSGQRSHYGQELAAYRQVLGKLYRAIAEVSGSRLIIDSSKNVLYSLVLNGLRDVDLHVIHLVRDSRAVAYSWQRKRVRPDVVTKVAFMDTASPWHSAWTWMQVNMLMHMVRPVYTHYTFLRYEDLVADPREVLTSLCRALGEPRPALGFLDHTTAYLQTNHTVAGNPMHLSKGPLTIRQDVEWIEKMATGQGLLVSALTLPLMLVYGYAGPGAWFRSGGYALRSQQPPATHGNLRSPEQQRNGALAEGGIAARVALGSGKEG